MGNVSNGQYNSPSVQSNSGSSSSSASSVTNINQASSSAGTSNNSSSTNNNSNGSSNSNSGSNSNSNSSSHQAPSAPTIVSGGMGNSGQLFGSALEANTYGNSVLDSDFSKNGYTTIQVYFSDGSVKYSVDFY